MTQAAFLCKRCGAELTDFLGELGEEDLLFATGEATVPPGHYARLSRSWRYREFVRGYVSADGDLLAFAAGDFLLNRADVRHQMSGKAVHGCCGWQPRDEPNALCANGHEIGTLHSDECWSAVVFRLLGQAVEVVAVAT
jgi:hypothetical protein